MNAINKIVNIAEKRSASSSHYDLIPANPFVPKCLCHSCQENGPLLTALESDTSYKSFRSAVYLL